MIGGLMLPGSAAMVGTIHRPMLSTFRRAYEQRRPSMEFLTDGGGPHEVANSCLEQHGYGRGLHYFNA
jgi:hypothetical protein